MTVSLDEQAVKPRASRPHDKAVNGLRRDIGNIVNLLHLIHEAIICIDQAGQIVVFSDGAEKTFGYTAGEMLGKQLKALIPKRFHQAYQHQIEKFLKGSRRSILMDKREPITGLRKNGEEFIAHASISRFTYGGEITITIVVHELRKYEKLLHYYR